jgi:hypothetical protein
MMMVTLSLLDSDPTSKSVLQSILTKALKEDPHDCQALRDNKKATEAARLFRLLDEELIPILLPPTPELEIDLKTEKPEIDKHIEMVVGLLQGEPLSVKGKISSSTEVSEDKKTWSTKIRFVLHLPGTGEVPCEISSRSLTAPQFGHSMIHEIFFNGSRIFNEFHLRNGIGVLSSNIAIHSKVALET